MRNAILLLLFTFIVGGIIGFVGGNAMKDPPIKIVRTIDTCITDNKIECIHNLMLSEGYSANVYTDNKGNRLIGFGHMIRKGEDWTHVSFFQAYEILMNDFDTAELIAETWGYKNNQKLAVAHIIFCFGEGKAKKILNYGVDKLPLYCMYNGKINQRMFMSRYYELNLYNK